jgi:phosphoribosyl 1,2-cyclic phosphodiesterase
MAKIHILGSGSKGNAAIVESALGILLIDCGFNKKTFFSRCAALGVDPLAVVGIIITHEHTDHIGGLGVCLRGLARMGATPAVYATAQAQAASQVFGEVEKVCELVTIKRGETINIAGMGVTSFATSHDAAEPLGLRIEGNPFTFGYMTDTGYFTAEANEALQGCNLLALETNHDSRMLQNGPYPYSLKQRIASDRGHLSNEQATEALQTLLCDQLKAVVGMHLSENNNEPQLAGVALQAALDNHDHPAQVYIARQMLHLSIEV